MATMNVTGKFLERGGSFLFEVQYAFPRFNMAQDRLPFFLFE